MSLAITLLTPFALLLPAAGAVEAQQPPREAGVVERREAQAAVPEAEGPGLAMPDTPDGAGPGSWQLQFVSTSFRPDTFQQVRIEQRVTIRIAPRARPVRPNMFVGVPDEAIGPRFAERKIGRCIRVKNISAVQANERDSLILYLRDERIVRASLERSCRARDFYSGFYLSHSSDGKLCVDRDALQSRSGANCKLTRIRQLVQLGD